MAFIDNDLRERISKFPSNYQKAVDDLDVYDKMLEIESKYELHIDQAAVLYEEIKKVLFGEAQADDFSKNLRNGLSDLSPDVLSDIVVSTDEKIFRPIHNLLLKNDSAEKEIDRKNTLVIGETASMKNPTELVASHEKDEILRQVETPVETLKITLPQIIPPPVTAPIVNLNNGLRNLDDRLQANTASFIEKKLTESTTAPRQVYKSVDPYRESPL